MYDKWTTLNLLNMYYIHKLTAVASHTTFFLRFGLVIFYLQLLAINL